MRPFQCPFRLSESKGCRRKSLSWSLGAAAEPRAEAWERQQEGLAATATRGTLNTLFVQHSLAGRVLGDTKEPTENTSESCSNQLQQGLDTRHHCHHSPPGDQQGRGWHHPKDTDWMILSSLEGSAIPWARQERGKSPAAPRKVKILQVTGSSSAN